MCRGLAPAWRITDGQWQYGQRHVKRRGSKRICQVNLSTLLQEQGHDFDVAFLGAVPGGLLPLLVVMSRLSPVLQEDSEALNVELSLRFALTMAPSFDMSKSTDRKCPSWAAYTARRLASERVLGWREEAKVRREHGEVVIMAPARTEQRSKQHKPWAAASSPEAFLAPQRCGNAVNRVGKKVRK